jgi:UDP-N-acetylglucosamine--dolichyl-phosphate N-acetylglucosaminephosphotransferase
LDNIVYLIISGTVSVLVTYYMLRWWITQAHRLGFTGRDMNKPGKIMVAEAGGVWVSTGAAFGILTYIALKKYLGPGTGYEEEFMALALLLFMSSFIFFQ